MAAFATVDELGEAANLIGSGALPVFDGNGYHSFDNGATWYDQSGNQWSDTPAPAQPSYGGMQTGGYDLGDLSGSTGTAAMAPTPYYIASPTSGMQGDGLGHFWDEGKQAWVNQDGSNYVSATNDVGNPWEPYQPTVYPSPADQGLFDLHTNWTPVGSYGVSEIGAATPETLAGKAAWGQEHPELAYLNDPSYADNLLPTGTGIIGEGYDRNGNPLPAGWNAPTRGNFGLDDLLQAGSAGNLRAGALTALDIGNTPLLPQGVQDAIPDIGYGPLNLRDFASGLSTPISLATLGAGGMSGPLAEALGGSALAHVGAGALEGAVFNGGLTGLEQGLTGEFDPGALALSTAYGAGLGGAIPAATHLPGLASDVGRGIRAAHDYAIDLDTRINEPAYLRDASGMEAGGMTVYHGSNGPLDGPIREGTFVTPNEADAAKFAEYETRLHGGEPTVHAFEADPSALKPVEGSWVPDAMQVSDPSRVVPATGAAGGLQESLAKAKADLRAGTLEVRDRYREAGVPKEPKGYTEGGDAIYGYRYSPEHFVRSDVSGRPLRYYVELDNGLTVHPDEIRGARVVSGQLRPARANEAITVVYESGGKSRARSLAAATDFRGTSPKALDKLVTVQDGEGLSVTKTVREWQDAASAIGPATTLREFAESQGLPLAERPSISPGSETMKPQVAKPEAVTPVAKPEAVVPFEREISTVREAIGSTPTHIDDVARATGMHVATADAFAQILELRGDVERVAPHTYTRTPESITQPTAPRAAELTPERPAMEAAPASRLNSAAVMTFDEYSARHGVETFAPQFPETHRTPRRPSGASQRAMGRRIDEAHASWERQRDALRAEYDQKVAMGEIRAPSSRERLERTAQGEGEAAAAARRALAKRAELRAEPAPAAQPVGPPAKPVGNRALPEGTPVTFKNREWEVAKPAPANSRTIILRDAEGNMRPARREIVKERVSAPGSEVRQPTRAELDQFAKENLNVPTPEKRVTPDLSQGLKDAGLTTEQRATIYRDATPDQIDAIKTMLREGGTPVDAAEAVTISRSIDGASATPAERISFAQALKDAGATDAEVRALGFGDVAPARERIGAGEPTPLPRSVIEPRNPGPTEPLFPTQAIEGATPGIRGRAPSEFQGPPRGGHMEPPLGAPPPPGAGRFESGPVRGPKPPGKIWDTIGGTVGTIPDLVSNVMRQITLFGHIGYTGVADFNRLLTRPIEFMRDYGKQFEVFAKGTRKITEARRNYDAALNDLQPGLADRMRKAGSKVGSGSTDIHTGALENVPGVGEAFKRSRGGAEVSIERARNQERFEMAQKQIAANRRSGRPGTLTDRQIRDIVDVSNHIGGTTTNVLNSTSRLLDNLLFAPRLLGSQFGLAVDAVSKGGVAGHTARLRVAQAMGTVAAGTVTLNLAMSGGKDAWGPGLGRSIPTNREDWNKLVHDAAFGKVEVLGHNISLWGPFDPTLRTFFREVGDFTTGDFGRAETDIVNWTVNHLNPLMRTGALLLQGRPLDMASFAPLAGQQIAEIAKGAINKDWGEVLASGTELAISSKQLPVSDYVQRDRLANDMFGKDYYDLPKYNDPGKPSQQAVDDARGGKIQSTNPDTLRRQAAEAQLHAENVATQKEIDTLPPGPDWRDAYHKLQADVHGQYRGINAALPYTGPESTEPQRMALDEWGKVIDKNTFAEKTNWDAVDAWLAANPEKAALVDSYLRNKPSSDLTGKVTQYHQAYETVQQSGYFDIRDKAWTAVVERYPSISKYGNDWDAVKQAGVQTLFDQYRAITPATASDAEVMERARRDFDKTNVAKDMAKAASYYRDQWAHANPDAASVALEWGYYTPKDEILSWLASQ